MYLHSSVSRLRAVFVTRSIDAHTGPPNEASKVGLTWDLHDPEQ